MERDINHWMGGAWAALPSQGSWIKNVSISCSKAHMDNAYLPLLSAFGCPPATEEEI